MQTHHISLPPGVVTGIGSLPHCDPTAAVAFVAQHCPTLPFWPELPQRTPEGCSIEQVCGPFRALLQPNPAGSGYQIAPGKINLFLDHLAYGPAHLDPIRAAGFFAFTDALAAGAFLHAVAVKGQMVGPLTLGWHLWVDNTPLLLYPAGRIALARYITRLAYWQIEQLAATGKPVVLFLDEPCLTLVPPDTVLGAELLATLSGVLAALRAAGIYVGVHTCATEPHGRSITALHQVQPDIISFDAYSTLEAFLAAPATQPFLAADGWLACGLIPTWTQLDTLDLQALFMRWLVAVPTPLSAARLAQQTIITATCGLGLLTEPAATASFRLAGQLGAYLAQVAASVTTREQ